MSAWRLREVQGALCFSADVLCLWFPTENYWDIVAITHARVPIVKFYLLKWYAIAANYTTINHWWVYWPKYFNESHGHTEFYICQTNCLTMKVFYLLNLRIHVFWSIANLSYDSESVDTLSEHTHFIPMCSSGRLRQEHRWQTGCISYKFLVADYEMDPATLSYKSLWHFDAPFYFSYWLAAYSMCLWHFEDNHTSLEHWSTSTNHMSWWGLVLAETCPAQWVTLHNI